MKKSQHQLKKGSRSYLLAFILAFAVSPFLAQVTYTFTNAGATGALGPSQAQVNAAYASTNLNGSVTVSSGIQTFTIPITGNYRIQALGGKGYGTNGGLGASIAGDFSLTAGTVLKIMVGQQGAPPISPGTNQYGGGGGSFVTYTNNAPLVIAGGGGGSWAQSFTGLSNGTVSPNGNNGDGANCNIGAGGTGGSGGGTSSSADGGGGLLTNGAGTAGGSAFVNGGNGGAQYGHGGFGGGGGASSWDNRRGGGGGGYSGGGGSHGGTTYYPEGGGGGSLNNGANVTNLSGVNSGDGRVIITRLCSITLGTSSGNNVVCNGSAVTLTTNAISNYSWSNGSSNSSITVSPSVTTTYSLVAMSPSNCMTSNAITITVSIAAPVLTLAVSSNTVCFGNTVSIGASGALTYTFSGGISNGVAFTPSANTTYTVIGLNGCGTGSAVTSISILPLPVIAIASPTIVCVGNTATLTGAGATTYTWQPGNVSGTNFIVSPLTNTTYTVTGGTGNCIGVNTVSLATNPIPTLTASATNSMICNGITVTLTAGGALSYTWQPGGQTGPSIVVTPTTPTSYIVTGANSFNCTSSTSQPVIVYSSPTINVSASNTLICSGGSAQLTASGADTYTWSSGATSSVTSVNPISNTVYTVVGTNTTSTCSGNNTISISVFVATIAVSNPTAICLGQSVTLNASGANSYLWSNGSTNSSILVSPGTTSGYTVNGVTSISSGTCASTGTTQVTVNPLPVVTASSTRTNICKGESTVLNAGGASTYLWNTSATTGSISVNPSVNTSYSVTGTNSNNCVNSATIQVKVFTCTGIDENGTESNMLSVYPNPSRGEITLASSEKMDLYLFNELGQLVQIYQLNPENNFTLRISNMAKGLYLLKGMGEKNQLTKRILIE